MVVKELLHNEAVLEDLNLYNIGMSEEKAPSHNNVGTSEDGLASYDDGTKSVYKVKELIYSSQEIDQKILGIPKKKIEILDGGPGCRGPWMI